MTDQVPELVTPGWSEPLLDTPPGHRLEPDDVEVYQFFLEAPATVAECVATTGLAPADADRRINRLIERRLLRRSLTDVGELEAVSPELAAAELAAPLQARAHQLMLESDVVRRELSNLSSLYRSAQRKQFAYSSTEVLLDGDKVRQRLRDLTTQVQCTLFAAHPTMPPAPNLRAGYELDAEMLHRGVSFRVVYPHTARRQHDAVEYMLLLQGLGAQVRTAPVIPARMILMDDEVALVPIKPERGTGAVVLRDPPVLDFLIRVFEHLWDRATPVTAAEYDEQVFEEIELSILSELAHGRTDEAIARRLGISTRTLRRYLTVLCNRLGVETRFQLGMAATRAGVVDDVGPASTPDPS
ncbi:MAG TPA: LuxR C-terminal-related transcriptional regulator [Mycobacteriales bacterium]|nr:LuxR C-terminal-related transcriptional regulator [Mycobacteriales bacterium]